MRSKRKRHLVVADCDIWVMVHFLGHNGKSINELQRLAEVLEHVFFRDGGACARPAGELVQAGSNVLFRKQVHEQLKFLDVNNFFPRHRTKSLYNQIPNIVCSWKRLDSRAVFFGAAGVALMEKLSKHDRYVRELCDQIRDYYDTITPNYKIRERKRSLGEVDILARKGSRLDLYEVKCSHRPIKARKQLSRLRRLLGGIGDTFFYCGSSGLLLTIKI